MRISEMIETLEETKQMYGDIHAYVEHSEDFSLVEPKIRTNINGTKVVITDA